MYRRPVIGLLVAALSALPILGARVPRPATDLTFEVPGGGPMNLSRFKGKVVALEFLLTTCPHCKRTSSVMQKLYGEYGPKGFQAIGVAFNDASPEMVRQYASELKLTYPVGLGNRDRVVDFLQHPIMLTLWTPIVVVIDKEGTIRGQFPGTDAFFKNEEGNMRQWIESLLAEKR